jgi:hypothetical protein
MSKEIGLPEGWEIKINALTGKACFFDTVNQTSHKALPDSRSSLKRGFPGAPGRTNTQVRSAPHARAEMPHSNSRTPLAPPGIPVASKTTVSGISLSTSPDKTSPSTATALARWSRRLDFATGRPYYVDHARKCCQWNIPEGFIEIRSNGVTRLALRWERRYDSKGRAYYVDHLNCRSQYTFPAGFIEPRPGAAPRSHPDGTVVPIADFPRANTRLPPAPGQVTSPQQSRAHPDGNALNRILVRASPFLI